MDAFSGDFGVVALSSCARPSFLFPKMIAMLVWRMGKSSVPKETLGLEDRAGET